VGLRGDAFGFGGVEEAMRIGFAMDGTSLLIIHDKLRRATTTRRNLNEKNQKEQ
jgi:hypothetical protein